MDSTQINNSNTLEALDCISRKMASEGIARLARNKFSLDDSYGFYLNGLKDADYLVSHLPSAQPTQEIIHCKDCKHLNLQVGNVKGDGLGSCDFHNVNLVTGEGFCYWADRRGEAE